MGIFKKIKARKNYKAETQKDSERDDVSFIKEIKHIQMDAWHQYDILLAARPYDWNYMVNTVDYMNDADLKNVGTVTTSALIESAEIELINEYHIAKGRIRDIPQLSNEDKIRQYAETMIRRTFEEHLL